MSRIDEIKKNRLGHGNGYSNDIEYLLSKLEAAEKALKAIKDKSQILASDCAHKADSGRSLDPNYTFEKAQIIYEELDKALNDIRS